jgi:hypothetical protein
VFANVNPLHPSLICTGKDGALPVPLNILIFWPGKLVCL